MRILKRSCAMAVTLSMVALGLAACGSQEDTGNATTTQATDVKTTENDTKNTEQTTTGEETSTTDKADATTITEDEAIELVKKELGDEFSYIPADELVEKDGSKYYEIYVKKLLEAGNLTTQTIYLVKVDGSEYFDKYVTSLYVGEFVHSGETGEAVFKVLEDGTFEITTSGEVNQVVTGTYEFGITDKATVIKLILHPKKVVNGEKTEENLEDYEGTAVIEDGKLTLTMESMDTVFTMK